MKILLEITWIWRISKDYSKNKIIKRVRPPNLQPKFQPFIGRGGQRHRIGGGWRENQRIPEIQRRRTSETKRICWQRYCTELRIQGRRVWQDGGRHRWWYMVI